MQLNDLISKFFSNPESIKDLYPKYYSELLKQLSQEAPSPKEYNQIEEKIKISLEQIKDTELEKLAATFLMTCINEYPNLVLDNFVTVGPKKAKRIFNILNKFNPDYAQPLVEVYEGAYGQSIFAKTTEERGSSQGTKNVSSGEASDIDKDAKFLLDVFKNPETAKELLITDLKNIREKILKHKQT